MVQDIGAWRETLAAIQVELEELFPPEEEAIADAAFEAKARTGALGTDWLVLQGRIDRGETSRAAIFSGEDETPQAERIRGLAYQRGTEIAEAAEDYIEEEGLPNPKVELAAIRNATAARGAALNARIEQMIREQGGRV